jgi:putative PIN family toxin of toxin-antitoxin system
VKRPAVIDTNVVVSGILTGRPESPTARILDGMLTGRFRFLISVALLAEYREVLRRPKITRRHRLSGAEVDVILTDIAAAGVVIEAENMSISRFSGEDAHLLQILAREPASVLVTGDKELFHDRVEGGRVLSPRQFVELIEA